MITTFDKSYVEWFLKNADKLRAEKEKIDAECRAQRKFQISELIKDLKECLA